MVLTPIAFISAICLAMSPGEYRRNRSGSKPPPRITIGTLFTLNARTPLGAIDDAPVRYEVTVRMPNVSLVELSTVPLCATEVASVYSDCAPSRYGHHSCGLVTVIVGSVTVWVEFAGTVTVAVTVVAVPLGGVTVADTVPVCALAETLVTSVFTVSTELDRSAAVFWLTCALPSISGPPACICTGNWMPVLLSGGICVQSTLSSVSIEPGSFGYTSIASELVPDTSRPVTSKTRLAYAPATVAEVATSVPLTHTSALPTTPLTTSFAFCPAGGAAKSVRYHHGTENWAIVSAPTLLMKPKQDFMFEEKNTLGQEPFCSKALTSVPGAPAPSL